MSNKCLIAEINSLWYLLWPLWSYWSQKREMQHWH